MPAILKPANLSLTWASGGDILNPGDTKYASGWAVEIPARQWFNYLDNRQDTALAHINQHGVVVWDATTEYQEDKSYVQGTTNGTIYRCIQTHTNQDPELDVGNVYWITAFASAGDFYTKTETDNIYLAKTQNLADLTNTATARTNLSVYSQAQTYTQAEVDAKTAVASALQSQQQTSNTVLLSALRLADAFKGGNQNLSGSGFQKLPGGLILQYGRSAGGTPGNIVVTLPIPFPTARLVTIATPIVSSPVGWDSVCENSGGSLSTVTFTRRSGTDITNGPSSFDIYWFALGY